MARLFTCGAELGHAQAEGLVVGTGTAPTFATDRVRTGARALKYNPNTRGSLRFDFTWVSGRQYWVRTYVNFDTLPGGGTAGPLIMGLAATGWMDISVGSSGQISVRTQAGHSADSAAGVIVADTWHRVELAITYNTGSNESYEIKVDGVTVLGPTSVALGTTVPTGVYFGHDSSTTANSTSIWQDDICINDDQGSFQNTWPGDGSVRYLRPASVGGSTSANWQKPGGSTTNRQTAVDNVPPVYETYDSTSASAEDYLRNAVSSANDILDLVCTDYDTAGVPSTHTITVVQAVIGCGGSSATDTAGDVGVSANPTISQASFAAFDNGVASATATTWPTRWSAPAYNQTPTRNTGPTLRVRKVTATTRVAIVNAAAVIVESQDPGTTTVNADLGASYNVTGQVAGDLGASYQVRALAAGDLGASYALRQLAAGDLGASYALRALAAGDLAATYNLAGAIGAELAATYQVRALAAGDLGATYAVWQLAGGNLDAAYALRQLAGGELACTYQVRALSGADMAAQYALRQLAAADLGALYNLAGLELVSADLQATYNLAGAVAAELAATYQVHVLAAGDLGAAYALRQLAAGDLGAAYALRALVAADLAAQYQLRTLSAAELDAQYALRALAAAELLTSYAITGQVGANLVAAYRILEGFSLLPRPGNPAAPRTTLGGVLPRELPQTTPPRQSG